MYFENQLNEFNNIIMKIKVILFIGLLMFLGSSLNSKETEANKIAGNNEAIEIVSSPELLNLIENLTKEYSRLNSDFNFRISNGRFSASSMAENENLLGFVTGQSLTVSEKMELREILIAREIIVPFINADNPFLMEIEKQGISVKDFQNVINNLNSWGTLLGNNQREPVQFLINNDAQVQSSVSGFLKIPSISVAQIHTVEELLSELQKNIYAIGFCKLSSLIDPAGNEILSSVRLLPIDKNGNNRLDYNENIYNDLRNFNRAVWIGKYQKELVRSIYTVSSAKPLNEKTLAFLSWILTDGQQFFEANGFNELVYSERQSKIDKLADSADLNNTAKSGFPVQKVLVVLLLVLIAGAVFVTFFSSMDSKSKAGKILRGRTKIIDENSLVFPHGMYFDKTHSWIFMEKSGMVKFGIDDFIPHITGNFTRIVLKNPGDTVKRNEKVVTLVQNGKQINIHAPVSGVIKDINETLVTNPELINKSPYEDGWIYMIQPSNWTREIQFFKLGGIYKEWIQSEFVRLKDFLACSFNLTNLSESKVVYQEGGEVNECILQDLGPEIWEDFQIHFIDTTELY